MTLRKYTLLILGVLVASNPLNSTEHQTPEQTKTEAATMLRAQKLTEQAKREAKHYELLSVPATLDVQDVYPDGSSVRFRRVATPELQPQPVVTPQAASQRVARPSAAIPTESHSHTQQITLTVTATENGQSLLHWKQGEESWQILTNVDLLGLEQLHRIPHQQGVMSVFILNLQSEATPSQKAPFFEILSPKAPAKLDQQLQSLHDYYLKHRQSLQTEWLKQQAMKQAEEDWQAANPAAPEQTVINFFKIR